MLSRIWKRPALLLSFKEKITHLWGERKCLSPSPLSHSVVVTRQPTTRSYFYCSFLQGTGLMEWETCGKICSCLSHCSGVKALLCGLALGRDLCVGSLAAWSLHIVFSVVWGAKCYSQASWTVTLLCSDKPHARTELCPQLFIRGKQIACCYQHCMLQELNLVRGILCV